MIFSSKVAGIPCQVEVTYFKEEVPAQTWGQPDRCSPSEPAEIEFDILDRRGRKAPWLEQKITREDVSRIYEEIHIMREADLYEAY